MRVSGYMISILVLGVLASSCVVSDSIQEGDRPLTHKGDDYVIFEYREDIFVPFEKSTKTTLTESELTEIEVILKRMVREHNTGAGSIRTISLRGKKRQYVPVINKNGEKEVWINFFCGTHHDKWRDDIVVVFDGGNCYFNVKINLAQVEYYDLIINGHA